MHGMSLATADRAAVATIALSAGVALPRAAGGGAVALATGVSVGLAGLGEITRVTIRSLRSSSWSGYHMPLGDALVARAANALLNPNRCSLSCSAAIAAQRSA